VAVRGRLKDMHLVHIINILRIERKTAVVYLSSDRGYGRLYLQEGAIVHASCRNLSGEDAFYHILTWDDGEFEIEPGAPIPAHTIHIDIQNLLLEGIRRMDESSASSQETDGYKDDLESSELVEKLLQAGILERVHKGSDA